MSRTSTPDILRVDQAFTMQAVQFLRTSTEVLKVPVQVGQGALARASIAHPELRKSANHRTG